MDRFNHSLYDVCDHPRPSQVKKPVENSQKLGTLTNWPSIGTNNIYIPGKRDKQQGKKATKRLKQKSYFALNEQKFIRKYFFDVFYSKS